MILLIKMLINCHEFGCINSRTMTAHLKENYETLNKSVFMCRWIHRNDPRVYDDDHKKTIKRFQHKQKRLMKVRKVYVLYPTFIIRGRRRK